MSCTACPKVIGPRTVRIACEKCKGLYHKECSGIAKELWSQYADGKYLFNCPKCQKSRRTSVITPPSDSQQTMKESDISVLKNDVSSFNVGMSTLKSTLADVEESLTFLQDSMTAIETKLVAYEKKFAAVDQIVEENVRMKNQIDSLERRIAALEEGKVKSRPKDKSSEQTFQATISGVKKIENEKIDEIFDKISTSLDVDIKNDVIKCERLSDSTRSRIMITIKSRVSLDKLIKAAVVKKPTDEILGGDGTVRLYVNENLTTSCYRLLRQAKSLKDQGYQFVWCRHGKVFVRKAEGDKVTVIRSLSDVEALKVIDE